jgi:hypothetical protein
MKRAVKSIVMSSSHREPSTIEMGDQVDRVLRSNLFVEDKGAQIPEVQRGTHKYM